MFDALLSRRGLSLERLGSFLKVADAGSITRAAGEDPVRQSQFSRQIGELEEFFGVQLTRRSGRSLVLTSAGRELAILVRAQFSGLDDFLASRGSVPVELSLGAGDSLVTWLVIPRLAALQKEFPRVVVRVSNLRSQDIVERLDELRLDFGLVRPAVVRPPLKHISLGSVKYRLFVPKRFQREASRLTPREMLVRFPIATMGTDAAFFQSLGDDARRRGIVINFRLITESFPQAAQAVAAGDFAAILPEHAAVDLDPRGTKSHPLPLGRSRAREVALAWNPRLIRTRIDGEALCERLAALLSLRK